MSDEPAPSLVYKEFEIDPAPYQLADTGGWKAKISISPSTGEKINPRQITAGGVFPSKEDAIQHCYKMGKMVIDDQIPNTPPLEQFTSEVLPSYAAYMSDMSTIWKARCAAYMVGHFAEHVWFYYNYHDPSQLHGKTKRAEDYVVYLAETYVCQELKIVWDIALSSKHRFLNAGSPLVDGDTGTFAERLVPSSTGALAVDSGRLWMPDVGRCFDEVIEKAVNFWRRWLLTAPT